MYTLGINFSHHASVALLKDNEVILFVLEERLNRNKNYIGLPIECLRLVKQYTDSIDLVVGISGKRKTYNDAIKFLQDDGVNVKRHILNNPAHHLYHASAGFYMSGFDEASCLVIDGAGAINYFRDSDKIRASETTSIYETTFGGGFKNTYKRFTVGIYDCNFKFLYDKGITLKTPFELTEEEKKAFRQKYPPIERMDISTEFDIGFLYSIYTYRLQFKVHGEGKLMGLSGYGKLPDATHGQIRAYEIQQLLEKEFVKKVKLCRSNNIVLSGGCALNILGNSHIKRIFPHLNIYIDPVATDGTLSLGAAAHSFYKETNCKDRLIFNPYLGPRYTITRDHVNECARKYSI